jgi:hypothetical protein
MAIMSQTSMSQPLAVILERLETGGALLPDSAQNVKDFRCLQH